MSGHESGLTGEHDVVLDAIQEASLGGLQRCNSKAEIFDSGRNNTYPVDPNFFWTTQDCEVIHPTQMRTPHIFNALKMIWNHTLPEKFKILPHTEYRGVRQFPRGYRKTAVANLFNELMNRPDRTKGMEDALRRMAAWLHSEGERLLR